MTEKTKATVQINGGPAIPLDAVQQFMNKSDKTRDKNTTEMFNKTETGQSAAEGVAADQLRAFVERIERLEEEKKVLADDIKDIYAEAKGNGYDVKILRKVISLRKKQPHEREEEEAVLDLYLHALGMTGGGQ